MSIRNLIADNVGVLRQGRDLLARVEDDLYVRTQRPLFEYGVGSHFRHALDLYACFLAGAPAGRIDYDRRERDVATETDRRRAIDRIEETIEGLQRLSFFDAGLTVEARQDGSPWAISSLGRELGYTLGHTIHHYALIALLLRLQGFAPHAEFGVAPSTIEYWRQAGREEGIRCAR